MIGIRDLRADLAAHVRRAASGETTVISIGGSPAAALTPLAMSDEPPGAAHLSSLVASGALIAPRRSDGRMAEGTVSTWANVRLDRLLREIPRMTVYLDTSALVGLHLDGTARAVVMAALETDPDWCSSGLTLMESLALVDRVTEEPVLRSDLEDLVRLSWDRVAVVPVDQRCLDRAGVLIRDQPLRLADAIHLAAADRLPRPVRFVTFDPAQIPVAMSMGFDVTST